MKSICISTYVYGSYTKFIPFYIYSVLKSYPDYYVKILVRDQLNKQEKKSLNLLKSNLSTNFEVKENYFNNINLPEMETKGQSNKTLRWFIPEKEFINFKYAYIGDIDFLIVREDPPLLDGHLSHCKETNLPYSNRIRNGTERLSGLHFIIVKDYYEKIGSIINYYLNNLDKLYEDIKKANKQEEFFYNLVESTIGFGDIHKQNYRPHHGFHLGCITLEGKIKKDYYFPKKYANKNNNKYLNIKEQIEGYFKDPLFLKMLEHLPVNEIINLSKYIYNEPPKKLKSLQSHPQLI